jgi:hypothetical protein
MPPRATTVELLPEKFDLPSLLLAAAGLGALAGTLYGRVHGLSREERAARAEDFAVLAALLALVLFLLVQVSRALPLN